MLEGICFDRDGLVPCVVQDHASGEVLTLAYMNEEALRRLERTLRARAAERPDGSYTVELLDDPERIGAKISEEAGEAARAAAAESDQRLAEEAADVLYHLSVLLLSRDVSQGRVLEV